MEAGFAAGKISFCLSPPPTPLSNSVGGFLTQSSISPPPSPPRHKRPPLSISLAVKIASLFSPFLSKVPQSPISLPARLFSGRLEEKGAPERKGRRRLQRRVAGYLLSHPIPSFPFPTSLYPPIHTEQASATLQTHLAPPPQRTTTRKILSSPPFGNRNSLQEKQAGKVAPQRKGRPQQHNTCVCVYKGHRSAFLPPPLLCCRVVSSFPCPVNYVSPPSPPPPSRLSYPPLPWAHRVLLPLCRYVPK